MIKILILTYYFPPDFGGIEKYIYTIINESKCKFFILAPFSINRTSQPSNKNILKIYYYIGFKRLIQQNRRLYKILYLAILFFQFINGIYILLNNKDIKAIFAASGDFIIVPFLLSKLFGKKLTAFLYGNDIKPKNNNFSKILKGKMFKQTINYAHIVCTISDYTKNIYLENNNRTETLYILNPFLNSELIDSTSYVSPRHKRTLTLITVGRIVRRKGYEDILKALKILKQQGIQFRYLVVGEGPFRYQLYQLAKKLKVEQYITFTGTVKDVSFYYRKADIFIMPSIELNGDVEGFGLVFLEAGIHSLPVIGTRSGGIPDAVVHKKTGLLVNPGNVKEIVASIQTLINNYELRKKLSFNGYQHASNIGPNIEIIRNIERKIGNGSN